VHFPGRNSSSSIEFASGVVSLLLSQKEFKNGSGDSGLGSGHFHFKLGKIIDEATSHDDFIKKLNDLCDEWKIGNANIPPGKTP